MVSICEIHHDWLSLPDGVRLAYRAWMPEDATEHPVPAILEFLPYRKNDGTLYRDEITMSQTAQHGYACIRVDLRGCGESEGLFEDEYSEQELEDGCDVIAWIAEQAWCNGQVGMVGISWGGFNALQVAAKQPPALKAIISQCSTDDRYQDDIHYKGGCLLNDNFDWAAYFWAYALGRAPDAKLVGDDWRTIWLERLNNMPMLAIPWLTEQTRSEYWQRASVCEDYSAIQVPVYAISGWSDGYRNSVFRLLEHLTVPKRGLIGPWCHAYPNMAYPKPAIDYVAESVRWWDKWLKGVDNGIDREPELHYYLQDSVPPKADYTYRAGQWVSEASWPSPNTEYQSWFLAKQGLQSAPTSDGVMSVKSPQTVGLNGGNFFVGMRIDMEQPVDQRADDAGSLTFDSDVLSEPLVIAGQIQANLSLCSDQPQANLVVRVCDVQPNGEVTRITYGVLNLNHRNGHEAPEALIPGALFSVNLGLNHIAYTVPKGHKVRVSVSTAYWPLIWPNADDATLSLSLADCSIVMPLNNKPQVSDGFAEYEESQVFESEILRPMQSSRNLHKDYKTGISHLETLEDFGCEFYQSTQSQCAFEIKQIRSIGENDPLSAKNCIQLKVDMGRDNWQTQLNANYSMTCDKEHFIIAVKWQAYIEGKLVFEKDFKEKIARHFV